MCGVYGGWPRLNAKSEPRRVFLAMTAAMTMKELLSMMAESSMVLVAAVTLPPLKGASAKKSSWNPQVTSEPLLLEPS